MAVTAEQRTAIYQEIATQVPNDAETHSRTVYLLTEVMSNGTKPKPETALGVALTAAQLGDVRTTAIALSAIPATYDGIPVERRGQVLLSAVHTHRDNLLDQFEASGALEIPHDLAVTQASMNALREALGVSRSKSPLFADPYARFGSRRMNGSSPEPIPAMPILSVTPLRATSRRLA